MVPPPFTEDYYIILGVAPTAERELIVASYRRLALKLHPDRNSGDDATAAFQLLQRAYETLEDPDKRRDYDYTHSSTRKRDVPPSPPDSSSTEHPDILGEAAQIVALHKAKQDRANRWRSSRHVHEASISGLREDIRLLHQEIQSLKKPANTTAEGSLQARRSSQRACQMPPFYGNNTVENEAVKASEYLERQKRKIERDLKRCQLQARTVDLQREEHCYMKAQEEFYAANRDDDAKIAAIRIKKVAGEEETQIWRRQGSEEVVEMSREQRAEPEKQEREGAEAQRMRQANVERERDAEAEGKRQAQNRATEWKRQQEQRTRQSQHAYNVLTSILSRPNHTVLSQTETSP